MSLADRQRTITAGRRSIRRTGNKRPARVYAAAAGLRWMTRWRTTNATFAPSGKGAGGVGAGAGVGCAGDGTHRMGALQIARE